MSECRPVEASVGGARPYSVSCYLSIRRSKVNCPWRWERRDHSLHFGVTTKTWAYDRWDSERGADY